MVKRKNRKRERDNKRRHTGPECNYRSVTGTGINHARPEELSGAVDNWRSRNVRIYKNIDLSVSGYWKILNRKTRTGRAKINLKTAGPSVSFVFLFSIAAVLSITSTRRVCFGRVFIFLSNPRPGGGDDDHETTDPHPVRPTIAEPASGKRGHLCVL